MKLKSYHILYRLFSYLSDRTNGAPLFVRYKLLLGTLIIGLANTACRTAKPTCYVMPPEPEISQITCYDTTTVSMTDNVVVKGIVTDRLAEPLVGVSIQIKNINKDTVADREGRFELKAALADTLIFFHMGFKEKEIPVVEMPDTPIVMEEDVTILCYEVIIVKDVNSVRLPTIKSPLEKKKKKKK